MKITTQTEYNITLNETELGDLRVELYGFVNEVLKAHPDYNPDVNRATLGWIDELLPKLHEILWEASFRAE